ncbi:Reverse transcriptase [Theobroma cacao]|nr:Reverse transcriptase [Theobroma cacao]WRX25597.1 Reverse transcriptase [Theobroma cacao]
MIGDISHGVKTKRATRETCEFSTFISQIEPKKFEEAEKEERNKVDEHGNVVRNKARIEAIRLLLAFACFMNFKLFQMDVNSAFLNGFIQEEVYVEQPSSFEDFEKPDHVFKLHKALYGLKQAPKACFEKSLEFQVVLSDYFEEMKLKKFSTFKNRYYSSSLVKEFYASITLDEDELKDLEDFSNEGLNVFVNGKKFVVTATDLGSLLKIKYEKGDLKCLRTMTHHLYGRL